MEYSYLFAILLLAACITVGVCAESCENTSEEIEVSDSIVTDTVACF